ncbi:condensation domain-containing protein [Streptomyces sp. NPDC014894]|uniref:condensation domain-containing protein n=1 Tax=Streptomyces sp. NPDC014894 TaxID=3364931 RepID=UPI003701EFD5
MSEAILQGPAPVGRDPRDRMGAAGPPELTSAQAEVLAAQRAAPDNAAYNVGQYIELTGPLDAAALEEAVRHTLAEAAGLHFRVREAGGRLYQEPAAFDAGRRTLPRLDTSGAGDPTAAAVELVREQLACPPRLDLLFASGDPAAGGTAPPLTGAVLVTVGPRRHLLFQFFHHLAVDGYGVSLLTRRIAEVYTARLRGGAAPASPFAPVAVLAAAERAYRDSARYADDRAHWAARYADGPAATSFATGSAPPSDTALRRTAVLDRRAGAAVAGAARSARVTWAEAVSAALAAQLHRETGAAEPVLALYAMARTAPGTLRVPGMAVNTLPVRLPVTGRDTFAEVLGRAGRELAAVRAHQLFRGEEIARELWPGGARRLPGPLLNLRPFDTELDFAGTPGHVVTLASGPVDDLSLSVVRNPDGGLRLDFDANPALYDARTLDGHAARYTDLLRRLCAEPSRPLADFPPLDEAGVAAALAAPAPGAGSGPGPDGSGFDRAGSSADRAGSGFEPAGEEEGPLPLLPSAHRLRETGAPVERLQESLLLTVEPGLSAGPLRRALALLARAHAALRLRLHRLDGVWATEILPSAVAPAVVDRDTLRRVDVRGTGGEELADRIAHAARSAVRALDPVAGRVLRAVWFDAGPDDPGRLLLAAHRLAVDDASWPLITERLAVLVAALSEGREPPEESAAGGLRSWAAELSAQAQDPGRVAELPYWRELLGGAGGAGTVPYGPPGPERVTGAALPAGTDPALLDRAVLGALALAAADEPRLRADGGGLLVELELPGAPRPERTVGNLTPAHPVRVAATGALAVPDLGRGHEQLRHLHPQAASVLAAAARPAVRYTRYGSAHRWTGPAGWTPAPARERAALRTALAALPGAEPPVCGALELSVVAGDRGGPVLRWRWAGRLFTDDEARALTARITTTITTLVTGHDTSEETSP